MAKTGQRERKGQQPPANSTPRVTLSNVELSFIHSAPGLGGRRRCDAFKNDLLDCRRKVLLAAGSCFVRFDATVANGISHCYRFSHYRVRAETAGSLPSFPVSPLFGGRCERNFHKTPFPTEGQIGISTGEYLNGGHPQKHCWGKGENTS